MHFPSLFVVVVYLSGYLFLLFAAVCLACGLYYLVELAEEYTLLTKRLIRYAILAQFILHGLLWAYERFPFFPTLVGFLSHLVYLLLLQSFPFIEPKSPQFIASCFMFVANNYFWFGFFHSDVELFYRYRVTPVPAMASFFLLVVWLVPVAFFVSLTVNDSVLPSASSLATPGPYGQPAPGDADGKRKYSRNLILMGLQNLQAVVRRTTGYDASPRDILSSSASSGYR